MAVINTHIGGCDDHVGEILEVADLSEEVVLGNKVEGRDKESFLKEMSELWDLLEKEGLETILGFEYGCGEVVKINKILTKQVEIEERGD